MPPRNWIWYYSHSQYSCSRGQSRENCQFSPVILLLPGCVNEPGFFKPFFASSESRFLHQSFTTAPKAKTFFTSSPKVRRQIRSITSYSRPRKGHRCKQSPSFILARWFMVREDERTRICPKFKKVCPQNWHVAHFSRLQIEWSESLFLFSPLRPPESARKRGTQPMCFTSITTESITLPPFIQKRKLYLDQGSGLAGKVPFGSPIHQITDFPPNLVKVLCRLSGWKMTAVKRPIKAPTSSYQLKENSSFCFVFLSKILPKVKRVKRVESERAFVSLPFLEKEIKAH